MKSLLSSVWIDSPLRRERPHGLRPPVTIGTLACDLPLTGAYHSEGWGELLVCPAALALVRQVR